MPSTPLDSSPDALRAQLEAYRRLPPEARVELSLRLSDETREISLAGIRQRHPQYTTEQARFALYRLLYGDLVFGHAWPGCPRLDP